MSILPRVFEPVVIAIARLNLHPDRMPQMLDQVAEMADRTRAEVGCREYTYLRSPEQDDVLVFLEMWDDRESLRRHLDSSHVAEYRNATVGWVLARTITVFDVTEQTKQ